MGIAADNFGVAKALLFVQVLMLSIAVIYYKLLRVK